MNVVHSDLAAGRWNELSLMEQLANIGSEIARTISWRDRSPERSQHAFERALELTDLTIADQKNRPRLREICRMREILVDYFMGENLHGSSDDLWNRYFLHFACALRR